LILSGSPSLRAQGKKLNTNPKSAAAADRKQSTKESKAAKDQVHAEDSYWKEASKGEKDGKKDKKKDEKAASKSDAAARKAEIKKLAEQEELEMAKSAGKKDKGAKKAAGAPAKVTQFELAKRREKEAKELASKPKDARVATADEYDKMVATENKNASGEIDASSVESALAALSVEGDAPKDKHPEKRRKALHKAFEERELPALREDYPGLKLSQYKEKLFEMWKKSPENPENQPQD